MRCNKKATHISTAWGFRACNQHVINGMIPYRKELDTPLKFEKDFQRCDQPLYEVYFVDDSLLEEEIARETRKTTLMVILSARLLS